jgi:hypothetical protein
MIDAFGAAVKFGFQPARVAAGSPSGSSIPPPKITEPDGTRDTLGLWIENTEGAKFWMKVFNDLKTRGAADILIAVTDALRGIAEALGAVLPETTLQTCIVHLIRNSLDYAGWKDRKLLAAALKPVYTAPSAEAAQALDEFEREAWVQSAGAARRVTAKARDRLSDPNDEGRRLPSLIISVRSRRLPPDKLGTVRHAAPIQTA